MPEQVYFPFNSWERKKKETTCINKRDCGNNGSLVADAEAHAGENQTLGLCDLAER